LIIKPNYTHQVIVEDTWRALLLIQPEAKQTQKIINRYLINDDIKSLPPEDVKFLRQQLSEFNKGLLTIEEASSVVDTITARLAGSTPDPVGQDPRVQRVMELIHQANGHDITLNDLADQVSLSCSRLSHLFSNQVGLPIKRYMLWYKICRTCFKMFTGSTIAKAAIDSGFSDAAHYTRACRQVFGMAPSQFIRQSHVVKLASDISIQTQYA
jgi:AraC-like DNA-binding protein